MKSRIKRSFAVLALFGLGAQFVSAQALRLAAEESPLATVFYLLSTTGKDSNKSEKACLAHSFAKVEKFAEAEQTANLVEESSYVDDEFISLAALMIQNGKIKEASHFVSFLLQRFADDDDNLEKLLKPLIGLGRDDEALMIVGRFSDSDKIDAAFEMAAGYLETGNAAKALRMIESISDLVGRSKESRDKAKLGLFYARLGKEEFALGFLRESLKIVDWTKDLPEYEHARIIDHAFESYLLLGKYQLAHEMLEKQGKTEDASRLIELARSYSAKGNRKETDELLERAQSLLNPNEYGDGFDLGRLIEIYLQRGEVERALGLAKKLSGSHYMQQKQLLDVADFYAGKRNEKSAHEVLNFALEQAGKINTDDEESGLLWTSGKWDQARYQSQIAVRLIGLRSEKKALEVISKIKKPYLRALMMTELVEANAKRTGPEKLGRHLEEALSLLRNGKEEIFDSNRYDVYASVARNFAAIGRPEKANEVFVEVLSKDKEMVEKGLDNYLLIEMCKIGVEYEKSRIRPSDKLKAVLRNIIKNWEDGEY
jgi:tetratricopeptide (TPR) repeat protein